MSLLQWPLVIIIATCSILQISPVVIVTMTGGHSWNDHYMLKSQHRAGHCCNDHWSLLQWLALCITNTDLVIVGMSYSVYHKHRPDHFWNDLLCGHSNNDLHCTTNQPGGHCWNDCWSLLQCPALCITNINSLIFGMTYSVVIPTMICYVLQINPMIIVTITTIFWNHNTELVIVGISDHGIAIMTTGYCNNYRWSLS